MGKARYTLVTFCRSVPPNIAIWQVRGGETSKKKCSEERNGPDRSAGGFSPSHQRDVRFGEIVVWTAHGSSVPFLRSFPSRQSHLQQLTRNGPFDRSVLCNKFVTERCYRTVKCLLWHVRPCRSVLPNIRRNGTVKCYKCVPSFIYYM